MILKLIYRLIMVLDATISYTLKMLTVNDFRIIKIHKSYRKKDEYGVHL
jgi:hypothetical protein